MSQPGYQIGTKSTRTATGGPGYMSQPGDLGFGAHHVPHDVSTVKETPYEVLL